MFTQCSGLQASAVELSVKAGLLINWEAWRQIFPSGEWEELREGGRERKD